MSQIAALFVEPAGIYAGRPDVELWPESRDARTYAGKLPVVAHPPCARWSVLARLTHSRGSPAPGDDGGTFASALASVERCGGVLEHPRLSAAWPAFCLARPTRGQWLRTRRGWTTEGSQCAYGHRAQKLTWLYLVGAQPPALDWSLPDATHRISEAHGSARRPGERMCRAERKATPAAFAELLLDLARNCTPRWKYAWRDDRGTMPVLTC